MSTLPPTAAGPDDAFTGSRWSRHSGALLFVGLTLACACGASFIGMESGDERLVGVAALLFALLGSGLIAVLYVAAGVGLVGPIASRLTRGSRDAWYVQIALGAGGMCWVSHLLGVAGLLSGAKGQAIAAGVILLGLVMFLVQVVRALRDRPRLPRVPGSALMGAAGLGIMLCAACSVPGVLWRSEAGGFDALSYHLPLAQEWASGARLEPLKHNVYSFLPGAIEAGFLHISALLGGGAGEPGKATGLLAYEGAGVLACQLLHALYALIAALLSGRVALRLIERAGVSERVCTLGAGLAFAAVLALPWTAVTGSLAYNEMAACAMFAGALLAIIDRDLTPGRRGLLAGLLMGLACAFKPTALFVCGPTCAALIAVHVPRAAWVRFVMMGLIGGVITFGPPLLRNWVASGNPVFPAGASVFGTGHWTTSQSERFASGHREKAPIGDRIGMLVSPKGYGTSVDAQPRGFLHAQWSLLPVAGVVALIVMSAVRWPLRASGIALSVGLFGACVWWVGFTHAQSRFLLPMVVPMAIALACSAALGMIALERGAERMSGLERGRAWAGVVAHAIVALVMSASTLVIFMREGSGHPNVMLIGRSGVRTGESFRERLSRLSREDHDRAMDQAPPEVFCNLLVPPDETIYLLGDSTPFYFTGKVLYHTTWDSSPIGIAMERWPDDPAAWGAALRARGVQWILLNFDEVARLSASGWYDPRVTPERLRAFAQSQCTMMHEFARPRAWLLRLNPGPTTPPKGPSA
jgi:hypothetical protein